MPADVLSTQALNRALLDRQFLLRRTQMPDQDEGHATQATQASQTKRASRVIETVEHLGGLQAQAPFPPYYGLWSRLAGFRPDDLAGLLTSRQVVRIALMRGTIHLVSARDCLLLRPLFQPVLDRALTANFGQGLAGVDAGELAVAGRALVEAEPRTFSELGALLAPRWPGHPPDALAQGVRAMVPLVQVPPRAVWGASGLARHTSAESWLGQPLSQDAVPKQLESLVERYLAAFGPASVRDIQTWSGLTRLREVTDRLGPRLRRFHAEDGTELFDLPGAPRPDPGTPAPVRLIAEFDNLVLSHADRSRVMSEESRRQMFSRPNTFPGCVLVNGFVAATWRLGKSRKTATLTLEPFGRFSSRILDEIGEEAGQLLSFAAPAANHDIRFIPAP